MTAGCRQWQLVIMAKSPVPGAVKTRLCPPLGYDEAAQLAAACIADTADAGLASSASRCLLALDGAPGPWMAPGLGLLTQRTGDFGARLAGAMADAWDREPLPMLVVGMDTPQVSAARLDAVAAALLEQETDVVLGPAYDGGYWVIGCRRPVAGLFDTVPMSTHETWTRQRRRVLDLGLRCRSVAALRDVDDVADARSVAAAAPHTRFARALREMVIAGHREGTGGRPRPSAGRSSDRS